MRTEVEIRAVIKKMTRHEDMGPTPSPDGRELLFPLNGLACDILRWVLGEPSEFGGAVDQANAQFRAARN